MTQNTRYRDRWGSYMDQAVHEFIAGRPKPVSLTKDELDVEHNPVTTIEDPEKAPLVEAWVRYPETVAKAYGRAIAWTSRAVLVEWPVAGGGARRAWVWASAVTKRPEGQ